MKNEIKYFYNLEPQEIINKNNYYFFIINNNHYYFKIFDNNIDNIKPLSELSKNIQLNLNYAHELIPNKDNKIISIINNIPYYLFKINITADAKIKLSDISNLANQNINHNIPPVKDTWPILWSNKIDYLEYQINEMGKRYPILVDSFNYFVGMAENAISYANDTIRETKPTIYDKEVISHIHINTHDTMLNFYDISNLKIDHKARDLAEYIKMSFFNNNKNIFNELNTYFKHNMYTEYGIRMLFARIMYPSFYFNEYDNIINGKQKEENISLIIKKIDNYQEYLKKIYTYLKMFYNIPSIEWLTKKRIINPH